MRPRSGGRSPARHPRSGAQKRTGDPSAQRRSSAATFGRPRGRDGQFVSVIVNYCFVALCLARSSAARRISRTVSVPRTTLRRAFPFFTVEVRRRPRLATTSIPDAQSSESRSPQAGFDRESHRASAAAFGAKKVDPSPTDAASSPKGRILPSLVPDEPLRRPLRDAALTTAESDPPSRTPKRPSVRTLKGKDQTSRLPRNSRFSSDENAPLAERLSTKSRQTSSAQSDEGAGVSPRVATTAQSQVVGDSNSLALSAKAKRRDKAAISSDDVRAKPLPNDQRSATGTDSPVTLSSIVDDRSPQSRKRTIMARYVFGDELKPGERWKRRLLTTR
jgi:hypothetical protein